MVFFSLCPSLVTYLDPAVTIAPVHFKRLVGTPVGTGEKRVDLSKLRNTKKHTHTHTHTHRERERERETHFHEAEY